MQRDVDADTVDQLDRPHRHPEVDRRPIDDVERHAGFRELHGFRHVRGENPVDDEAGRAHALQRELADAFDECETRVEGFLNGVLTANNLDQRQLRDRVEKVQPDEPPRFPEPLA